MELALSNMGAASSHRGHLCRPLTTKTLLSKPSTNALNDFWSKPYFLFIELVWELFHMCVCVFVREQYLFCILGLGFFRCLAWSVVASFWIDRVILSQKGISDQTRKKQVEGSRPGAWERKQAT